MGVFHSVRTDGSTFTELSTCASVTARTKPSAKGSPQTLVCTKTQSSYERRLKQFENDLAVLKNLETIGNAKNPKRARLKRKSVQSAARKRTRKTT